MSVISPVPIETHQQVKKQHFFQPMDSKDENEQETSMHSHSSQRSSESPAIRTNSQTHLSHSPLTYTNSSGDTSEDVFQKDEGESCLPVSCRVTTCTSSDEPIPSKCPRPELVDMISPSTVLASSELESNSLPCPCGQRFSDSSSFIEHARQCGEFAKTATSFAEAAAAVASSFPQQNSPSPSPSSGSIFSKSYLNGDLSNSINEGAKKHLPDESVASLSKSNHGNNAHTDALDLSLRPNEYHSKVPFQCQECKFSVTNASQLLHHFESEHNLKGKFICLCRDVFAWLPNLMKHQLTCSKLIETKRAAVEVEFATGYRMTRDYKQTPPHSPVSGAVHERLTSTLKHTDGMSARRSLSCTGCGKSGFQNTSELFNHFGQCNQMVPQLNSSATSPSQKTMYSESNKMISLLSHPSNSASSNGTTISSNEWKQFSGAPIYSPSMNISGTYPVHKAYDLNTASSTNRFPVTLLPPLGVNNLTKTQSNSGSLTHPYFSPTMGYAQTTQISQTSPSFKSLQRLPAQKPLDQKTFSRVNESASDLVPGNMDLSRPFKCCHCIKAFKSKALLDQHMHIHYPPKYTCRYCAKKYRWPPVFYHHQRTCKKRPPATSATSTDNNSATVTVSGAFTSRSHTGTASEPPFSVTMGAGRFPPMSNIYSHNFSSQMGKTPPNPMLLFPPFPMPHSSMPPDLYSANTIPDFQCQSLAENEPMGFAALAAAAAMGMRFPFSPIPPPLGLTDPYICSPSTTQSMLQSFPKAFSYGNFQTPPFITPGIFSPPQPTISSTQTTTPVSSTIRMSSAPDKLSAALCTLPSTHTSLPNNHCSLTEDASFSTKVTAALPPMNHSTFNCVCGTHFKELSPYLTHLATCSALHQLASLGMSNKKSDSHLDSSIPWFPPGFPLFPFQFARSNDSMTCKTSNDQNSGIKQEAAATVEVGRGQSQKLVAGVDESANQSRFTINRLTEKRRAEPAAGISKIEDPHEELSNSMGASSDNLWFRLLGSKSSNEHETSDSSPLHQLRKYPRTETTAERTEKHECEQLNQEEPSTSENEEAELPVQNEINRKCSSQYTSPKSPSQFFTHCSKAYEFSSETMPKCLDSSTSLMAAMASVLANAAAAAGFGRRTDTGNDMLEKCDYELSTTPYTNGLVSPKLCVQCGKEFSSRLSLKQHVEGKHSAEGKYQCPGCAKRYRWGASYYYHKKSCPAIRDQSPPLLNDPTRFVGQMVQEDTSPVASSDSPLNFHQNDEYEFNPSLLSQRNFAGERSLHSVTPEHRKFDGVTSSVSVSKKLMNHGVTEESEIWSGETYPNQMRNDPTQMKPATPHGSDQFLQPPYRNPSSSTGAEEMD